MALSVKCYWVLTPLNEGFISSFIYALLNRMSTPSEFLAKGAIRVIARNFQVGLGLGEGLGFKISTPFDV